MDIFLAFLNSLLRETYKIVFGFIKSIGQNLKLIMCQVDVQIYIILMINKMSYKLGIKSMYFVGQILLLGTVFG